MNPKSNTLLPKKGTFDLQGYNPKRPILPYLKLKTTRSITPEFASNILSSTDFSSIFNKTPENKSPIHSDRPVLPLDMPSIKSLIKPLSLDSYPIIHDSKVASNRQLLISLEKWYNEASLINSLDLEPVIFLSIQELIKEIAVQCSNRARLIIILFTSLRNHYIKQIDQIQIENKLKRASLTDVHGKETEKLKKDNEIYSKKLEDYIEKYITANDRSTFLTRENEILKQVIIRFQQEYKLQPINFNKICELIIEDLADSSKRTQKRILNTVLPRYCKSIKSQTIETSVFMLKSTAVQCKPLTKNAETQEKANSTHATVQTERLERPKKTFGVFKQDFLQIRPSKTVKIGEGRIVRKGTKLNLSRIDELLPTSVITHSKENEIAFGEYFESAEKRKEEPLNKSLRFHKTMRSNASFESIGNLEKPAGNLSSSRDMLVRSFTPHPYHRRVAKATVSKSLQKAKDILNGCLKLSFKDLHYESTMSLRTLLKTIESMFYSAVPKLRRNNFQTFLLHVYNRMSSKYSLRRIKERRLRDLISTSIRHKDHLMAKLFLRSIEAGSILGLSNYSIHTFKIILQLINYFNSHLFGSPLFNYHGRRMCNKAKAVEFAKDIFQKRLDHSEYLRVLQQIDFHTEKDFHTNRGPMVEVEWVISYFIFTFDYYEKQVMTGTKQVMDAVTLSNANVFPMKCEIAMAVKALYPDSDKILFDKGCLKSFIFLSDQVSERSMVSNSLLERFCLYRGLFKLKHVNQFRKDYCKPVDEILIDELAFSLDSVSDERFAGGLSREEWQKKLYLLKEYKDPDLAFAIFQKEVSRILLINNLIN